MRPIFYVTLPFNHVTGDFYGSELHLGGILRHRIPHRGGEVGIRRRCRRVSGHHGLHVQFRQDGFRDFPRPDRRTLALDGHHENRGKRRSGPHSGTRSQPALLQTLPGHSQEPSRHRKHFHEHLCQYVGTGQCGHAVKPWKAFRN